MIRESRKHGHIECLFDFGDYKFIIKPNCLIALFSPVRFSCMSACLEKSNTWIHPGLECLPALIIEGQELQGEEVIC